MSIDFELVCIHYSNSPVSLHVQVDITARCPRSTPLHVGCATATSHAQHAGAIQQLIGNWCIQAGVGGVTDAAIDGCIVSRFNCKRNPSMSEYMWWQGIAVWWASLRPIWTAASRGWTVTRTNMNTQVHWQADVFRMVWWVTMGLIRMVTSGGWTVTETNINTQVCGQADLFRVAWWWQPGWYGWLCQKYWLWQESIWVYRCVAWRQTPETGSGPLYWNFHVFKLLPLLFTDKCWKKLQHIVGFISLFYFPNVKIITILKIRISSIT